MKTIFCVVILTIVFILGMVQIEKNRQQGLNEVEVSYQQALKDISVSSSNKSSSVSTSSSDDDDLLTIKVTISGAVKKAGTYEVSSDAFLSELIEEAGGVTSEADSDAYNELHILSDGDDIYIAKSNNDNKISINTADATTLDMLPSVGSTLANRIIEYRTTNGDFTCLEQLKNVEGIGTSIFNKIKDYIKLWVRESSFAY